MRNELWDFAKEVLDNQSFIPYIPIFNTDEDFIEVVPIIIELNKMNVRVQYTVDDPLQLLIAAVSRYAGEDRDFVETCLYSKVEFSTDRLRLKYSDSDIVKLFRNFEKVLNTYDYSSVFTKSDLKSAKEELLNCMCFQLFGKTNIPFYVDSPDIVKIFSRSEKSVEVYYPNSIFAVIHNNKLLGYFVRFANNSKSGVINICELNSKGYAVCGCTKKVKGEKIGSCLYRINDNDINEVNIKDVITSCSLDNCREPKTNMSCLMSTK